MKPLKPLILIILLSIIFFACSTEEEELIPNILSITPDTGVAHLPEFTMTVKGSDFEQGAVVLFNGLERAAQFVSSTELQCQIKPEDTYIEIASALDHKERAAVDLSVGVQIRNPGGEVSNTLQFGIDANYSFGTPVRLFDSLTNCWLSPITFDNHDNLHLLITEVLDMNRYWVNIYHSTSTDGGETWSPPELLLQNRRIWLGDIRVDEQGSIHIFYEDYTQWEFSVYTLRKDGGTNTWSEPRLISLPDKGVLHYTMQFNQVALRGNRIFVFWTAYTKGYEEYLMFRASGDHGRTWTGQRRLKQLGQSFYGQPLITADGTLVLGYMSYFVKWRYRDQLYDVYSVRSYDNGDTWTEPVMLSNGAGRSQGPWMVYSEKDNSLHALYIWNQTGKINSGAIKKSMLIRSRKPAEFIPDRYKESGDTGEIADITPGTYHVLIRSSNDSGENWGDVKTLASYTDDDDFHGFEFDFTGDKAGNLNLMLIDVSGFYDVVAEQRSDFPLINTTMRRSLNGGETWTEPVQLTDIPEMWPHFISIDNTGRIYITLDKAVYQNEVYSYTPYLIRSN